MKSNTKSSITLPPGELRVVEELRRRLGARTKVEVVRRGLRLLKETTDREELRRAYLAASRVTRKSTVQELEELDRLAAEGLDE
jgi:Arc/MetJ-type ribon-helix-helix transcriptional regulator